MVVQINEIRSQVSNLHDVIVLRQYGALNGEICQECILRGKIKKKRLCNCVSDLFCKFRYVTTSQSEESGEI